MHDLIDIYKNIQLAFQIPAFIADVILFTSIVSFRCLNARFHFNLLKHWCCIDATYLAVLVFYKFYHKISYDVGVTFCMLCMIVHVLFFASYIILFLIALEWTLAIYNPELSVKIKRKKNCLVAFLYLSIIFEMCFGARICALTDGNFGLNVMERIVTAMLFLCLVVVVSLCIVHQIKCRRNRDLRKYANFPLKISLFGYLFWCPQVVYLVFGAAHSTSMTTLHVTYISSFVGTCTPIFYVFLCLKCDKTYRSCMQYVFGCKAYDELNSSEDMQMEGRR